MTFPSSPRVVYDKNPLESVVCQLRFPPILRIDAEPPAAYQDRVRERYPLLRERPAVDLGAVLPPGLRLPPQVATMLTAELSGGQRNMAYDFITADGDWTVTLHREYLAVATRRYKRWEQFREHLEFALLALVDLYKPAFFIRIGLRYRNVILRSHLDLSGRPWVELLQDHIAAELSKSEVADAVVQALHQLTINLGNGQSRVQLRHGLGTTNDPADTPYLIDADFSTDQRTETDNAIERLNHFHTQAGHLFRWCIRTTLHQAMGPRSPE